MSGTFSRPCLSTRNQGGEQRAEQGQQHVVGQIGVEAELVGLVLAAQPAAQELQPAGDLRLPVGGGGPGTKGSSSSGRNWITRASGILHRPQAGSLGRGTQPGTDGPAWPPTRDSADRTRSAAASTDSGVITGGTVRA